MPPFIDHITPVELEEVLMNEERCLAYIAKEKWKEGYVCRKCGHDNYCKGKKPHSRRCTRCKHEESATAHTIFHGCHLPLTQAFRLAYQVCNDPSVSTYELARQLDTRQMTCWKLKKRMLECIESKGRLYIIPSSAKLK
ncbi:MAG: transposase [Bacteroidales bacterium]|nr:transposase [Bacteroidales bacterium]